MAEISRLKVTPPSWNSDKEPNGYSKWSKALSGFVRTCAGGSELEDYREEKLGIVSRASNYVPSCISSDPDFAVAAGEDTVDGATRSHAPPPRPMLSPGGIGPSRSDQDNTPRPNHSLNTPRSSTRHGSSREDSYYTATRSYQDLSQQAKTLDQHMYSIMLQNVTGSKAVLLHHVSFSSYVQASIVFSKHEDISRNTRKTEAIENMESLKFVSVNQWSIDSVNCFQELRDSKVTIEDYALMCLVRSLSGKSKVVQHSIVKDINNNEYGGQLVIYDLVYKYATELASVEGVKAKVANRVQEGDEIDTDPSGVNSINDVICHNCGKKGHYQRDCPTPKKGSPNDDKPNCTYCNKPGHKRKDCNKRKSDEKKKLKAEASASSANSVNDVDNPFSTKELFDMISKVGNGESVNHVKAPQVLRIIELDRLDKDWQATTIQRYFRGFMSRRQSTATLREMSVRRVQLDMQRLGVSSDSFTVTCNRINTVRVIDLDTEATCV